MLQTSLLLMKSLNNNRDFQFLIRSLFFVSKGNLFDVYLSSAGSNANALRTVKLAGTSLYPRL